MRGAPRRGATSKPEMGRGGGGQGLEPVKVRVMNVAVEHEVQLMDFTKWLERDGGTPREISDRKRIKSILGI